MNGKLEVQRCSGEENKEGGRLMGKPAGTPWQKSLLWAVIMFTLLAWAGMQPGVIALLGAQEKTAGEENSIQTGPDVPKVVRFHVVAHDDSPEEQELKNLVAGQIIREYGLLGEDFSSPDELLQALEQIKPTIEARAREVLLAHGSSREVKTLLGRQAFPARFYEGRYYPAGEYRSLKLVLGDGEGENWWCVIFPPFCYDMVPSPVPKDEAAAEKESEDQSGAANRQDKGAKKKAGEGDGEERTFRFWLLEFLFGS